MNNMERNDSEVEAGSGFSLDYLASTLKAYRIPILLSAAAVTTAFLLISIFLYFRSSSRVMTLPFRLQFQGADRQKYPNGTQFDPADVIAPPVLRRAYEKSGLKPFLPYPAFEQSLFVIESNPELEALRGRFQQNLGDRTLTFADRQKLEAEFAQNSQALPRVSYMLIFTRPEGVQNVPQLQLRRALQMVLTEWARYVSAELAAFDYSTSMYSDKIFDGLATPSDYTIASDLLNEKTSRVIGNLQQIARIPGSANIKSKTGGRTLAEIRTQLEEMQHYQIQPLLQSSFAHSKQKPAALAFLQLQATRAARQRDQSREHVQTLRNSLTLYNSFEQKSGLDFAQSGSLNSEKSGKVDSAIPQLGESFLKQLSELIETSLNVEFREDLIKEVNRVTLQSLLPRESEAKYYETLLATLPSMAPSVPPEQIAIQYRLAFQEIRGAVREAREILHVLSENLNPSKTIFESVGPATARVDRGVSPSRLMAIGLTLLLLSLLLSTIAAFLHRKLMEERSRRQE